MAPIFNQNLLPDFDSIKDNEEKIIWIGRPKFIPFILTGLSSGAVLLIFVAIWFALASQVKPESDGTRSWSYWIGFLPLALFLWGFFKKIFAFKNTSYGYSNKRVMMRTGFIGTDFKIIEYDKISDMEVTVNFIERAHNVGTIKFFTGRTQTNDGSTTNLYDNWESIPDPYEVFKQVKQIMSNIKTDFKMR